MQNRKKSSILSDATGPVTIRMTNDYLFRALLQRNNKVLKGLICSLLHLAPEQIISVVITNPIELGSSIDTKDFLLDIKCLLNNNTIINLEMQVINEHNWPERSLSYLCRSFDSLENGEDYAEAKSAIQIGILDFTLFNDTPEFFSTYMMMNVRNGRIYSSKFRLSVLDLTCIDLATEEDKHFRIDYWASLFKAATWEEIKLLAQKDSIIEEASNTIYQLTQEEKIRLQCEAREDYYRQQRAIEQRILEKDTLIAEKDAIIAEKDSLIAELKAKLEATRHQ